jgi:hypothetical protein
VAGPGTSLLVCRVCCVGGGKGGGSWCKPPGMSNMFFGKVGAAGPSRDLLVCRVLYVVWGGGEGSRSSSRDLLVCRVCCVGGGREAGPPAQ